MSEQTFVMGRAAARWRSGTATAPSWRLRAAAAVVAGAAALTITACGDGQPGPTVPAAATTHGVVSHAQALHLAGQCVRQHGVPGFPDPTVGSAGQLTFAKAALEAEPKAVVSRAITACRAALDRAGIRAGQAHDIGGRPSPKQMHAILAFARCMRAHGLTGLADPNPVTGNLSLPGTAKDSPVVRRAQQACQSLLAGT